MNESTKRLALIAVIVVAIVAAGFGATKFFGGDRMEVENKIEMPAGHKSEKEQALEGGAGGDPAPFKEKDLGG